jgi:hypothetical protein
MANDRKDTPLAASPEAVFAAIEKSSKDRLDKKKQANKNLKEKSQARRRNSGTVQSGSGKLQGLASLRNTLGTQYHKKPDSENSYTTKNT